MYDLVGDKIQEIFDAQDVDIGVYDREAGPASASRTRSSAACGYDDEPIARSSASAARSSRRGSRSLVNRDVQRLATELGQPTVDLGRAGQVGRCSFR